MILEDNSRDYLLFQQYITLKGATDRDRKKSYWGNVPVSSNNLQCLYNIYKPNMKLLDLGCGAGNVLRFAKNIGFDVFGVEFNKELTVYLGDYDYIHGDITKLSKDFYKKFDVIYAYRPLKKEFQDYVELIVNNMKSGSYILTPDFEFKSKLLKPISRYLSQKK